MKPKQRCDQVEQRRRINQIKSLEITAPMKVVASTVPFHAQPVVERLKRKLRLFAHLQLHYYNPAFTRHRKQVDEGALLPSISRHLRIDETRIERRVQCRHIAAYDR